MAEVIPDPDIEGFNGVYVGGEEHLPPTEYNLSQMAAYLRNTNKKFTDLSEEEKKYFFYPKIKYKTKHFEKSRCFCHLFFFVFPVKTQ